MMPDSKEMLRTDTTKEAFKSLEKLDETLLLATSDVYQWKWAIIILHNCMQAFMVLVLEGTNQIDVVKNRDKYANCLYKLSQNIEMDAEMKKILSDTQLDFFLKLYSKIKDSSNTQQLWNDSLFVATEEQDDAMELLNDYRNQFIHFLPCSWGIELSGLTYIFISVMSVIQFMIRNGNFMYKFEDEEKRQIQRYITSIHLKLGVVGHGE